MVAASPPPREAQNPRKGGTRMSTIGRRAAGAAVGALLLVGLGGAGFAYAQVADGGSSTTTNPPASAPAAGQDPANCHHGGGHGRGGGGGGGGSVEAPSGSTSTSPAPSAANPGSV